MGIRRKVYAKVKAVELGKGAHNFYVQEEDEQKSLFYSDCCKLNMPKALHSPDSDLRYNALFEVDPATDRVLREDQPQVLVVKEDTRFNFDDTLRSVIIDLHNQGKAAIFFIQEYGSVEYKNFVIEKIILTGEQ